ncbi:MAG: phosphonate metabolism protein/1,5-bisphosphokinase (PRPP-forming) PhnN [Pseudomonadota bacterium]|nr:phosphonate metabolism protein/1,5-bisphosphokinase (PRPP-forming) PhnN [Pseudomonadota bacterium]
MGTAPGTLVLVVGPSGVGKDSLIDGARAALAGDPLFVFVRRVITRPADAGGEDHQAVTPDGFERLRAAGAFALCWFAHDLAYGLPASMEGDIAAGRTVIANVSRAVVDEARRRFPHVRTIHVTAPAERLAERLRARGREDAAGIAKRLARAAEPGPTGDDVVEFSNAGALDAEIARFTALVRDLGAAVDPVAVAP